MARGGLGKFVAGRDGADVCDISSDHLDGSGVVVKQSASLLSVLVLVIFLSGCAWLQTSKVSASDLLGGWTSEDGATLELHDDGTFKIKGVPRDVLNDWDPTNFTGEPQGEPMDVSGAWLLVDQMEGASDQVVQITSESGEINYILVQRGRHLSLAFVLGDPDMHDFYVFRSDGGSE